MREILFRGKRADNGEWAEGFPIIYSNGDCVICNEYVRNENVILKTVGQYTGLTDKNGKKIFEGDIVAGRFNHVDMIGHIVYGSDACYYIDRQGLLGTGLNNAEDWIKVIGNIHDNPELLEEQE